MSENTPPALPQHISSDGREIWDWAKRLSEHTHRLHDMRELRRDIARIGRECGGCDNWMKSRICPREKNVNGWNRGPSMTDPVMNCQTFVQAPSEIARKGELQQRLSALEEKHAEATP
jgi:hypothetical protein